MLSLHTLLTLSSSKSYEIPLVFRLIFSVMSNVYPYSDDDAFVFARESARMWCARQERSTAQCRRKLEKYDLSAEQANAIIDELQRENFLSDERFAEAFVSGHIRIKRWGKIKIRQHLIAEGVGDETIRKALEEQVDHQLYEENLRSLLSKKIASMGGCSHPADRQKAIRFMQQKGYETERVLTFIEEFTGN